MTTLVVFKKEMGKKKEKKKRYCNKKPKAFFQITKLYKKGRKVKITRIHTRGSYAYNNQ